MKMIIMLIGLLLMGSVCFADGIGIELDKSINDGGRLGIPIWMDARSVIPFIPKAYARMEPLWTSPRGEWSFKHSRTDLAIGGAMNLLWGRLDFETGPVCWMEGNIEGIDSGWTWRNAVRYYWNW